MTPHPAQQPPLTDSQKAALLSQFERGRTDLVVDLLAGGASPETTGSDGVSLLQHCAYYGDVTAIKLLVQAGASLSTVGENLGLNGAVYHGHWRLCLYLLEQGADVNLPDGDTGETPLHSAVSKPDHILYDRVLAVLLAHGADPNVATKPGIETGAFMRDCRTKGESPLHRAAAFGGEDTIQQLIAAGANVEARDANGDTPLSWASWYGRPNSILRPLCYGNHRIHPENRSMRANLLGDPSLDV